METSKPQTVKRCGILINIAGEHLWYNCGNDTYKYIGKQVYAHYEIKNIKTVQVYDCKNDQFIGTWAIAEYLPINYN